MSVGNTYRLPGPTASGPGFSAMMVAFPLKAKYVIGKGETSTTQELKPLLSRIVLVNKTNQAIRVVSKSEPGGLKFTCSSFSKPSAIVLSLQQLFTHFINGNMTQIMWEKNGADKCTVTSEEISGQDLLSDSVDKNQSQAQMDAFERKAAEDSMDQNQSPAQLDDLAKRMAKLGTKEDQ